MWCLWSALLIQCKVPKRCGPCCIFMQYIKMFTLSFAGVLSGVLPPNTEEFDEKKGLKRITEYKYNEEGKIVKVH